MYSFSNSFDESEIQHIIDYCSTLPAVNAEIGSDMESEDINEGVRSSIVRWVPMNEETKYIYERLINMALEANNELWGFDVNSIIEEIQYTEYYGTNDGHYDWHLDIGDEIDYRKISITVQLSDKDEYEGGHLEMKTGPIDLITPKEEGLSTIFPSFGSDFIPYFLLSIEERPIKTGALLLPILPRYFISTISFKVLPIILKSPFTI